MTSIDRIAAVAAACWLAAWPARAADPIVHMQVPPPVGKGVAAMPLIADPADDAERRINTALLRHGHARVGAAGTDAATKV